MVYVSKCVHRKSIQSKCVDFGMLKMYTACFGRFFVTLQRIFDKKKVINFIIFKIGSYKRIFENTNHKQ
jgi:hypothetical protein